MYALNVVEVEIGDPRLGASTDLCQGFAIGKDIGTFEDNNTGYYLGLSAVQLSIYDYFYNIILPNPYEGTEAGDVYNTTWLITPVNKDTTFPGPIASQVKCYIVQDPASTDPTAVAAGFLWGAPFMQVDVQARLYDCIQLDVSHDIWSPEGGGLEIRSEGSDGTGYYARSTNPIGGVVDTPSDPYHCDWVCVFPPPVGTPVCTFCYPSGFSSSNSPNGGPFPAVLIFGMESTQSDNSMFMDFQCFIPESWSEVLGLRAMNYNGGGLEYNTNSCPIGIVSTSPYIIEDVGPEGRNTGYDKGVWGFYFLCNPGQGVWVYNGVDSWTCCPVSSFNGSVFKPTSQTCFNGGQYVPCGCSPIGGTKPA